jgi:hypothetical protein
MKANEFRILGPELGETDSFIDVTVNGIDGEGTVYFSENGGGREWQLSNKEIRRLSNQNFMIEIENVEAHGLWDKADGVGGERKHNVTDDFADENTQEAQKSLFLAAYFETR